jgi:hypothetical protein
MYKRCICNMYIYREMLKLQQVHYKCTTPRYIGGVPSNVPWSCAFAVYLLCMYHCIYIYIYIYIYEKSKKIISYLHRIFIDFGWWVGSFYKEIPWGSGTQISNKKITWKIITDFPLIGNPNQIGNDAGIQL